MWEAQSKQTGMFRLTPKVMEGLRLFFPLGVPVSAITEYESPAAVIARLRPHLPATVNASAAAILDGLPDKEPKLAGTADKPSNDPATPAFGAPGQAAAAPGAPASPDPRQSPPKGGDLGDAAGKALEAAFELFRKTELGKELEKSAKK
jgi:hypothetical protein